MGKKEQFLYILVVTIMASLAPAFGSYECTNTVTVSLSSTSNDWLQNLGGADSNGVLFVNSESVGYTAYTSMDSNCKGDGSTDQFIAQWPIGDCDPVVTANETHINYHYTIWQKPMLLEDSNPSISRYDTHKLRFDCFYSREGSLTTNNYITPNRLTAEVDTGDIAGNITFSTTITESDYTTPVSSTDVKVDDWIYVQVALDDVDYSNLVVALENCYAQSTSTGGMQYDLITNYCVVDNSWDEDNSIVLEQSGSAATAHLKVKSFVWNNAASSHDIYITCTATVCNNSSSTCTDYVTDPSCASHNKRRRRRRAAESAFTLMAGPASIIKNRK